MNPIWIILTVFGIGLFAIVYFGIKAANNSNIPSVDQRKPLHKMSRRELRRMQG